jgi:MarR family transcriptional regulator for hemolysin
MSRLFDERTFSRSLLRLSRTYRREVNHALSVHGISDALALPVLQVARLGEGVRQRVLAEDLGIEGPSLVGLLDQLCAQGLMERRPDPQDGRAKTLHLTDQGRALAVIIESAVDRLRSELLVGVSDEDLAATLRLMAAFDDAIEANDASSQAKAC